MLKFLRKYNNILTLINFISRLIWLLKHKRVILIYNNTYDFLYITYLELILTFKIDQGGAIVITTDSELSNLSDIRLLSNRAKSKKNYLT